MEFSVKGITFKNEDLVETPLEDLRVHSISRSHLFHIFPNGRRCVLLLRAGEMIKKDFLKKYTEKGIQAFSSLNISKEEDIDKYKSLWNELKRAKSQKAQLEIKEKIIVLFFKENLIASEKSILSFVISCFEEFYQLPEDVILKYQDVSYLLFTRGLLLSSFAVLTAFAYEICDFKFVKDFYNINLFMDFGLVESGSFNFMMSMACEAERKEPGSGLKLLKSKNRPVTEWEEFKEHPMRSFSFVDAYKEYFYHKEIIEFIKYHHEKSDGSGFPGAYFYSGLSQTEVLMSFCDNLIPFEEHIFNTGDGHKFLTAYFDSIEKEKEKGILPIEKIYNSWFSLITWGKKNSEVAS